MTTSKITSVTVLGTGEALNSQRYNSSYYLEYIDETGSTRGILVDCGLNTVYNLMNLFLRRHGNDKKVAEQALVKSLSHIYITHAHADHFFGIPLLLLLLWENGRSEELKIITSEKFHPTYTTSREAVEALVALAYYGMYERFESMYDISYHVAEQMETIGPLKMRTAPMLHSVPVRGVRFDCGEGSVAFGGDGKLTSESESLFAGAKLVFLEGFTFEQETPTHERIVHIIEFAEQTKETRVGIVHINRNDFEEHRDKIRQRLNDLRRDGRADIFLARDHERFSF